jgi:hypothetical protein
MIKQRTIPSAPRLLAAAFASILAASTGGCALSVEAEIPEVEITHRGLMFEAAPIEIPGEIAVSKSFSQEHGKLEFPEGLESEVKTLAITLKATSGVSDLSFIRYLRISMSAGAEHPAIELGTYDADTDRSSGPHITLTTLNPVNVLDAWKTESATFTLDVAGSLPTRSWTADITVRFAGKAKYSY